MLYVGMDVSSKSLVMHVIDERKRVVARTQVEPSRRSLHRFVGELGEGRKLIAFEAGNQMKWIAEALKQEKLVDIHVVHPTYVKWIHQSSGKTDKVDAKKLAELARGDMLPRKVHIVEGKSRELRELVSARTALMQKRVSLLNTLRGYLKQEGVHLGEKFFAQEHWRSKLEATKMSAPLRAIVGAFRSSIEALTDSEQELQARLLAIKDERVELAQSVPSIGPLTSRVLVSGIDDATRFDGKKAVAKYGALVPTVYQSGEKTQLGRISRDGRHEMRRVLLQCAHTVMRMRTPGSQPLQAFYLRIERRRGKKRALVALARKLLTTVYGVLKSGEPYDPAKLAPYTA